VVVYRHNVPHARDAIQIGSFLLFYL